MIARYTSLIVGIAFFATEALGKVPICPVVNTKYGTVFGSSELSRNNRSYMSFKGIPYAKPPVGELRFQVSFFFLFWLYLCNCLPISSWYFMFWSPDDINFSLFY